MSRSYTPRHKTQRPVRRLLAGAVAAAATVPAVVLVAAPSADAALCSSAPGKCFLANISPSSFVAGSTVEFRLVETNEGTSQSLGSSNIDAPAGYTITHLGTPSSGTATLVGSEIQLRSMNVAPGKVDSLTFTASTPATGGAGAWVASAKQSNDYNGTGNDFVLDPASAVTTTGVSGSTAGCSASDVSCGTNFINYNRASRVSTGTSVNPTVWFVGHIDFPATSVTGGQRYSMEAPAQPGSFCPVNGAPAQCTFEMRIDDIPAPYDASHAATLTLLCDPSHCNPNAAILLFKKDASGAVSPVSPCPNVVSGTCYTTSRDSNGVLTVVVSGLTTGDPSFAGISIP